MEEFVQIKPVFDSTATTIILSTDSNYIEFLSVTLSSIRDHSDSSKKYDIVVFEYHVPDFKNKIIEKMFANRSNFSIRFFDVTTIANRFDFNVFSYYSNAIYFRLFAPFLMTAYKQIVYIDCDLIVLDDISYLQNVTLGDNYAAVVKDIGAILHYYTKGKQYVNPEHFTKTLGLKSIEHYFNSGVMVLNLDLIRKDFSLTDLIEGTSNKDYLFPDQDGLNVLFKDRTVFLPMRWNVLPQNSGNRTLDNVAADVPAPIFQEYFSAREKPSIIHYAMREKPWRFSCELDYSLMIQFWECAHKSPFFKDILFKKSKLPYFEKEAILKKLSPQEKPMILVATSDVHYGIGGMEYYSLSDAVLKYESLSVVDDELILFLSGYFSETLLKKVKFWISNTSKQKFFAEIKSYEDFYLNEVLIGRKIILKVKIKQNVPHDEYKVFVSTQGVNVKITNFNFSKNFPIDKILPGQYYCYQKYILRYLEPSLIIDYYSSSLRRKFEKNYRRVTADSNITTKQRWFRRCLLLAKRVQYRQIWLFSCNAAADDNGYSFFDFVSNNHKEIRSYFIVRSGDTEVIKKIRKIGHAVKEGSFKHRVLSLLADRSISSVVDSRLIRPFYFEYCRDLSYANRFVFLQHGVISQDLSREHNRFIYNPIGFVTSTTQERDSILNGKYFYMSRDVWLTGLPRYDYLYHNEKNIVTIMPTWRKYLYPDLHHETDFFKHYYSLLHNPDLLSFLSSHGYTIQLRLHPLMVSHSDEFLADDGALVTMKSYRDVYAESKLIITDYSSAVYDFIYLRKPILYYQFDYAHFYSGAHAYDHGYLDYEKAGFGEVEYEEAGIISRIKEYVLADCKIKKVFVDRINNFFDYSDKDCCKRVYDKVINTVE